MSYAVNFVEVSTEGLESSPVADALAGLRANEARYFKNKYDHVFTVDPATEATDTVEWVHGILKDERDLVISARPLEATQFVVDGTRWAYVFYESGLSINVLVRPGGGVEACGGVQAVGRHGRPRGARGALQVRAAEVQARRHDPRLVLRDQERALSHQKGEESWRTVRQRQPGGTASRG